MNLQTPTPKKQGWLLIILGLLLIIGEPLTLFIIYGNNEITGPITQFWPVGFLLPLGGAVLVAIGVSRFRRLVGAVERISDTKITRAFVTTIDRRSYLWVWFFIFALGDAFFTSTLWHNDLGGFSDQAKRLFAVSIFAGVILLLVIHRLMYKSRMPWYIFLLDPRFEAKDEREQDILQRAALQTVGTVIIMVMVFLAVLIIAPTPSLLAIVSLYSTIVLFIRAAFGFFAWRLGMR